MGNISLVRVGAVCAILVVLSAIVARIFFGFGDIVTGHWFDVLALVLTMAAALGFYQALRQAGPLLWIAVVAYLTGVIFVLVHEFIRLGMAIELAPSYAEASAATRPALEVMANTLRQTSRLASAVGSALIFGVGVLLFSFAILRTSVVPKWIGWLGLIVALLGGWLALWMLFSGVFHRISFIGLFAYLVWSVAMGVVLLRLKESVAPDSAA